MSSFMISTDCMDNIINGLFWKHEFKNMHSSLYEDQGLMKAEDFRKLAYRLFELNQKALMQRYNEKKGASYNKIPDFKWEDKKVSNMQFLKSMACLRYQCSEGSVPRTKLFKWLSRVIDAYQSHVIYKIPAYTKAKWD